jgi:hypothetical protein
MGAAKRSRTGNLPLKTLAVGPGLNIDNAVMAGLVPAIPTPQELGNLLRKIGNQVKLAV